MIFDLKFGEFASLLNSVISLPVDDGGAPVQPKLLYVERSPNIIVLFLPIGNVVYRSVADLELLEMDAQAVKLQYLSAPYYALELTKEPDELKKITINFKQEE